MILDKLNDQNIPYAVMISITFLRESQDTSVKDYCLIGSAQDYSRLRKLGFKSLPEYLSHKMVLEYDLDDIESREFDHRAADGEYNKILQNKEGRIYEVPGKSLKERCGIE